MRLHRLVGLVFFASMLSGQTVHLKTRVFNGGEAQRGVRTDLRKHWQPGRNHFLLQFRSPLNDQIRAELTLRGAVITGTVPDDAVVIAAGEDFSAEGLDTVFVDELTPDDKVSAVLGSHGNDSAFIVEFHADVEPEAARALLAAEGLTATDHPDLSSSDLLIVGTVADVDRLKQWDEVAYVFPAPQEMVDGERFHNCIGALSSGMAVAQYVRMGHGWSPDASGRVNLGYAFGELTAKVPAETVKSEIIRAMAEWSKVAPIQFAPAVSLAAFRTIAIKFAARDHGDGFPFDGPNGILAHTFYPSNPEPIAGDLHMDGDEGWHAGTNIDVYTVALHELGHALGLGHSDQPGAIMYPYYRYPFQIGNDDIAGIQALYGAPAAAAPVPVAPVLSVAIKSPSTGPLPVNTTAVSATGIATNGVGRVSISWQTDRGASGAATVATSGTWVATGIPTPQGSTTLTFTAMDGQHRTASKSVVLSRQSPAPQDTAPPSLAILAPLGTMVQTSDASLAASGTASDNTELVKVTWENGPLGSGTAAGTKNWTATKIPLLVGTNNVIFRAYDAAGNSSWRSVTVIRR